MGPTVVVCGVLAGLSLLGPSEPSFDPWAWLVWGREIAHGSLDIASGPSWKPLPVVFTTLFAPLSAVDDSIPRALWMVVARTGGLVAVVLSFKLAARLAGGGRARRAIAGVVAAVALVTTPDWTRYLFHGSEAPLTIALLLWAVDRHLDDRPDWALVLGGTACLARPELFPFLALYGSFLWARSPRSRVLVAAVPATVVAAWVIPPWLSTGDPLSAEATARSEPSWSLSLSPTPWRAALDVAQDQSWLVLELAACAAVALALAGRSGGVRLPRPAHPAVVVTLGAYAATMVALFMGMTEAGFSGNPRYVFPAAAAISLVGAVGVALAVEVAWQLGARAKWAHGRPRVAGALVAGAAATVLAAAGAPDLSGQLDAARAEARDSVERSRLHAQLDRAVDAVGASYVTRFGPATVNRSFQTHLAWELSLHLEDVHGTAGQGIVFRAPEEPVAGVVRIYRRARRRMTIATVGSWTVSARPPNARHVYTWPVARFNLRSAAKRVAAGGSPSGT